MAKDVRNTENPVDEAVLAFLPEEGEVVSMLPLGLSDYCDTYDIDVKMPNGNRHFFAKVGKGPGIYELLRGTAASETGLYEYIPEFVPRPVGFGSYKSDPNVHFFLLDWVEMRDDEIPDPVAYMAPIAALHSRSMGKSPEGKFGFDINTAFGNLFQENHWEDSWEVWWTRHMTMVLDREEKVRGDHTPEDAQIRTHFMNKVLPRYLRPLESDGRSIKPCLLHTDYWPGNIKYQLDSDMAIMYDSSSFWGHNEVELGVIRNPRYPLGRAYLKEYWKHVPISEPQEDADSRNIMYLVRNQACLSTLYPDDHTLRNIMVNTMRVLVNRVLEEESQAQAQSTVNLAPTKVSMSSNIDLTTESESQKSAARTNIVGVAEVQ